jgi:hypothetical protein
MMLAADAGSSLSLSSIDVKKPSVPSLPTSRSTSSPAVH